MKYLYSLILVVSATLLIIYLKFEIKKNEPDETAIKLRLAILVFIMLMSAMLIPIYW